MGSFSCLFWSARCSSCMKSKQTHACAYGTHAIPEGAVRMDTDTLNECNRGTLARDRTFRMTYWSRRQHSNIFGHPNNRFWTCLTMMAFVFVASLHFNLLKLFSWKYHTVSSLARTRYTTIYNLKRNLEQQNGTSFFIMPHGNCTWHVCIRTRKQPGRFEQ